MNANLKCVCNKAKPMLLQTAFQQSRETGKGRLHARAKPTRGRQNRVAGARAPASSSSRPPFPLPHENPQNKVHPDDVSGPRQGVLGVPRARSPEPIRTPHQFTAGPAARDVRCARHGAAARRAPPTGAPRARAGPLRTPPRQAALLASARAAPPDPGPGRRSPGAPPLLPSRCCRGRCRHEARTPRGRRRGPRARRSSAGRAGGSARPARPRPPCRRGAPPGPRKRGCSARSPCWRRRRGHAGGRPRSAQQACPAPRGRRGRRVMPPGRAAAASAGLAPGSAAAPFIAVRARRRRAGGAGAGGAPRPPLRTCPSRGGGRRRLPHAAARLGRATLPGSLEGGDLRSPTREPPGPRRPRSAAPAAGDATPRGERPGAAARRLLPPGPPPRRPEAGAAARE